MISEALLSAFAGAAASQLPAPCGPHNGTFSSDYGSRAVAPLAVSVGVIRLSSNKFIASNPTRAAADNRGAGSRVWGVILLPVYYTGSHWIVVNLSSSASSVTGHNSSPPLLLLLPPQPPPSLKTNSSSIPTFGSLSFAAPPKGRHTHSPLIHIVARGKGIWQNLASFCRCLLCNSLWCHAGAFCVSSKRLMCCLLR